MTPIWPLPALVYSVTELTRMVKKILKVILAWAVYGSAGEIGTFKRHSSGHVYVYAEG